jgi:HK97 family phage major capsid protein
MKDKILLQLEGGKEVDLREVIKEAGVDQLKEMGFPIGDDGKVQLKQLPAEVKTEAEKKVAAAEVSANFIKSMVVPSHLHAQHGVKAFPTDTGAMGSTVPVELANAILEKKGQFNILRQRAFSFNLAGPFDLPTEGTGVTGYWVGETDTADANLVTGSEPTTSKKTLDDHYLAALVKFSWKLLNTSAFDIQNYVASLAGRKLAETEEAAFVGGSGTGRPKGIRQETVTNIAQAGAGLAYQDILNLYHLLPPQYRQNAVFLTSGNGSAAIHGLADSQGRPIFQPGQPLDQLFNKPLLESADMPENLGVGTDTTEVWFGDPSYYHIKYGTGLEMASDQTIERLQSKLLIYQAVDAKMVLTDAFVKITGVKVADES